MNMNWCSDGKTYTILRYLHIWADFLSGRRCCRACRRTATSWATWVSGTSMEWKRYWMAASSAQWDLVPWIHPRSERKNDNTIICQEMQQFCVLRVTYMSACLHVCVQYEFASFIFTSSYVDWGLSLERSSRGVFDRSVNQLRTKVTRLNLLIKYKKAWKILEH
jgi:hypothetical protein